MKLKNILPIVGILFALFSCSLEEDQVIYNEIESSVKGQSKDAFVNVSFAITSGDVSTKGGSSIPDAPGNKEGAINGEADITDCSVIILNGTNVVAAQDNIKLTTSGVTDASFLLEAKKAYTIMVVANSTVELAECETLSEVEGKIQSVTAFTDSELVKVGSYTLAGEDLNISYQTIEDAKKYTKTFTVTVSQLAAKIEFAGFNLNKADGFNETITVKSVTLKNLNYQVLTKNDMNYVAAGVNSSVVSLGANIAVTTDGELTGGNVTEYTFPNTASTTAIEMSVTFQVGNQQEITKSFVINRPSENGKYNNQSGHEYVKSNHIYRVKIAATVQNGTVGYELVCYTLDWKYNQIEIELN